MSGGIEVPELPIEALVPVRVCVNERSKRGYTGMQGNLHVGVHKHIMNVLHVSRGGLLMIRPKVIEVFRVEPVSDVHVSFRKGCADFAVALWTPDAIDDPSVRFKCVESAKRQSVPRCKNP